MAFVQLDCIRPVPVQRWLLSLPMPCEVYAGTRNPVVVNARDWVALKDADEEERDCPEAADAHHDIQEFAEAGSWEDAVIEH